MANREAMISQAWKIRREFKPEILFAVPGVKHYDNPHYSNRPFSFANLSVTGEACSCQCAHCKGSLLSTMIGVENPQAMCRVVDKLSEKDCRGILISGGADVSGEVPLASFSEAIGYAKQKGLTVLVHSGLIRRKTAAMLKKSRVDQVLMDVIGDEETIREVCHLNRKPEDYLQSMCYCREAGLSIAPHIVIGLHFGQIRGEYNALEMINKVSPETIVLIILNPVRDTAMAGISPPSLDDVAGIMAAARVLNPLTPITLGCARPPGQYKRDAEKRAIDCGVNGIAYPDETAVDYAESRGLKAIFSEECCSLLGKNHSGIEAGR
ncbi:MAG: biotin synthase [Smithella sp. PtaU1.Bin162]|nr:MAG: biotin synthase [Smithella sp. PtaU1.Bin162]